jgi:molybdopterin/thiamine biosynthesis adenylyltransferase
VSTLVYSGGLAHKGDPPADARVVIIGAGGIGAPLAMALVAGGVQRLVVVDDDRVELSNLHRQILFRDEDVGRLKLDAFASAIQARSPETCVELIHGRALPSTAVSIVKGASVVIDATDNFASRFLLADACAIAGVSVVHAAAVRWNATVFAVAKGGRPCYRCLFEDLPGGDAPDCATAGVVGPVCGVAGAIAADRALRILVEDDSAYGSIVTFDGLRDVLRSVPVRARAGCELCGAPRAINAITPDRYDAARCAN